MPKISELSGIRYWSHGDKKKPCLILVHGFTGSHGGFQYIIPQLEKDFFIIAPDLPGFGMSDLPKKPWSVDSVASAVNTFIKSLNLEDKPYIVSHSLGGLVAASMLTQSPELFQKKTAFISPVATKIKWLDSRKVGALFGTLHYSIGKRTGKFGDKLVRSKRINHIVTNVIMTTKDTQLRQVIHALHDRNLEFISSIDYYRQLHRDTVHRGAMDYISGLKQYESLIIAGAKDTVTPLKGERSLAKALHAKLEIIPDVGHLAHYESPDAISQALLDFLV